MAGPAARPVDPPNVIFDRTRGWYRRFLYGLRTHRRFDPVPPTEQSPPTRRILSFGMSGPEPHLLVVDDDARLLELLRRYLTDNGFRVTTAQDAGEARAKLAAFAFDLIVLDVMMPGESGLDLTRALRRDGRVPVLLLTAMVEPEDRVNDYLAKPFEPRELVLRIRNVLQRRPADDSIRRELRFGGCRFDLVRSE